MIAEQAKNGHSRRRPKGSKYVQEEALIFFPNEISIPTGSITSQVCPHQLVKLADNRGINSVADNEERSMERLITEG